jgi:hypothetical protein
MIYWSAQLDEFKTFEPSNGWNTAFSEQDKIAYTNLFFFFKNKKGFTDTQTETYVQMILFKQKYMHIKYSEEQEQLLKEALRTVYN